MSKKDFFRIIIKIIMFCFLFKTIYCFYYVENENGLILRTMPTTNSEKIVIIPKCSIIDVDYYQGTNEEIIDGVSGKWVEVSYEDIRGWAFDADIANLSVMISKSKRKKYFFYKFILPKDYNNLMLSNCYDKNYDLVDTLIDKTKYLSNVFKGKKPKFYILEENKNRTAVIKNFNIGFFNNGMYDYPAISFISPLNFDNNSLLLKEEAYLDFIKRHKKKMNSYKKRVKSVIKLKNIDVIKTYEQWLVDMNGDNKEEIVSYVSMYEYRDWGTNLIDKVIITFKNSNIIFYEESNFTTALLTIQLVPFHDYPVIKMYRSSLCSGDNGEFIILFKKNSKEPLFFPVNFTHSY